MNVNKSRNLPSVNGQCWRGGAFDLGVCTSFTHKLSRIRKQTSEISKKSRLIEGIKMVRRTFHECNSVISVVLGFPCENLFQLSKSHILNSSLNLKSTIYETSFGLAATRTKTCHYDEESSIVRLLFTVTVI